MQLQGVICDIDGVIVASPHEQAWRETLELLMETEWRGLAPRTRYAPERFTTTVYQQEVAGKPRELGARAALEFFAVPDAAARAARYGQRKQETLMRLIQAGQFDAFPDALRFLLRVKSLGLPIAAASSSKNAHLLLGLIHVDPFTAERRDAPAIAPGLRLLDLFDVSISIADVARGKPAPDMFLAAAAALGAPPERCLVVEDAPSGVQAAKAAGMMALGVARQADAALLAAAGADRIVTSLDELALEELAAGRIAARAA